MLRITTLWRVAWTYHSLLSCLHCPQEYNGLRNILSLRWIISLIGGLCGHERLSSFLIIPAESRNNSRRKHWVWSGSETLKSLSLLRQVTWFWMIQSITKEETGGLMSWMRLWDTHTHTHLLSALAADVNSLVGRLDKVRQVTHTHIEAQCVNAYRSIVGWSIGRILISSNGEHQSDRSSREHLIWCA